MSRKEIINSNEYGNRDGLLSDEVLHFDTELFCEAILRCDLSGVDEPWVWVEATDCAVDLDLQNLGRAAEPSPNHQWTWRHPRTSPTGNLRNHSLHPQLVAAVAQTFDHLVR